MTQSASRAVDTPKNLPKETRRQADSLAATVELIGTSQALRNSRSSGHWLDPAPRVGQWVQDVDRIAHIQALSQPPRARCALVQLQSRGVVRCPQCPHRIGGHRDWKRDIGQGAAVRPPEAEGAVGLSINALAFFVDRAVVSPTEHREIGERGGAAVGPVTDVVAFAPRQSAAREAAAAVAMVERAPQCGRNRARASADLDDAPVLVVAHQHAAGITRQALRCFRGNVGAAVEHRLAGLIGVGQHRRIDVNHHLVPLARRPHGRDAKMPLRWIRPIRVDPIASGLYLFPKHRRRLRRRTEPDHDPIAGVTTCLPHVK